MRELVESALKGHNADYLEVRLEEAESTVLRYRGRELEEVGRSAGMGGCVRAAVRGGWGFVSFNDLSDIREKVAQAVQQARLVGSGETLLADVEPVVDVVEPSFPADPRLVPLAEKKRVLDEYVELLWGGPAIQTSSLGYADGYRKVYFGNSFGTYTERTRSDVNFRAVAVARDGGGVQQAGISMGSLGDFGLLARLHDEVAGLPDKALAFLKAPQVKGGEYPVIPRPHPRRRLHPRGFRPPVRGRPRLREPETPRGDDPGPSFRRAPPQRRRRSDYARTPRQLRLRRRGRSRLSDRPDPRGDAGGTPPLPARPLPGWARPPPATPAPSATASPPSSA